MSQKKKKQAAAAMVTAMGVTSIMGPCAILAQEEDSTIANQQSQVEKQQDVNDVTKQELKEEGIYVSEHTKLDEVDIQYLTMQHLHP